MASIKKLPVWKIVSTVLIAVVFVGIMIVSVVVAMKWVTLDVSWTRKIPPGETEHPPRVLLPDDWANVEEVHEVIQPYVEEALGTLKAATRTEISARVLTPIQRVTVRAGQEVKEGDDLVILDRRTLETQRSKAHASLVSAQASLDRAEKDYARARELIKKNIISHEEFDENTSRVKVARANLDHAQQALAEADVTLSYAVIKAPKSGIIVDRLAEEGDMAQPGVPLLILYDPTSLRLEVPVMENLAVKLKKGDKLEARIDSLKRTVEATVDEVVPQAQAASRSFLVKVALPKAPGMFEGMFGRLLIPAGTRRFLCLNTAAIERIGQNKMVDVVHPDGTLERRLIKTGRVGQFDQSGRPTRVEVLSGLDAHEKVLLQRPPGKTVPEGSQRPANPMSTEAR